MNLQSSDLQQFLPDNALTWEGFSRPLILNLNNLAGEELTPESSLVEVTAKWLQALHSLTSAINTERSAQSPPKPPIEFISRQISSNAKGNAVYNFIVQFEVDAATSLDAVVNPLATP